MSGSLPSHCYRPFLFISTVTSWHYFGFGFAAWMRVKPKVNFTWPPTLKDISHRCGSKTGEPEASRLADSQSLSPSLSREGEVRWSPPLHPWPPPSPPQPPCKTYSGKSRATTRRMFRTCTPTGSKSTATLYRQHRPPQPSSSSSLRPPPKLQSLVPGRRSSTDSSTWDQHSLDLFLVPFPSPWAGSLTTPPRPARIRLSGASSPRAWFRLGLNRLCMEAALEVEAMPLWTR